MRTLGLLGVLVVLVCSSSGPVHAQSIKKARKTLNQVLLVDGAGSGLDADTVRGLTPEEIAAGATQFVGGAIAGFLDSAYTRTATFPVSFGFCNTIDQRCDDANDFLLNCGGAVGLTTGYLTAVTEVPGAGGLCRAGGCGDGGPTSVAVTATCLVR